MFVNNAILNTKKKGGYPLFFEWWNTETRTPSVLVKVLGISFHNKREHLVTNVLLEIPIYSLQEALGVLRFPVHIRIVRPQCEWFWEFSVATGIKRYRRWHSSESPNMLLARLLHTLCQFFYVKGMHESGALLCNDGMLNALKRFRFLLHLFSLHTVSQCGQEYWCPKRRKLPRIVETGKKCDVSLPSE